MTIPNDDPSAYPDMDAIRDAHNARSEPGADKAETPETSASAAIDAFRASMTIDYEKWHDGIGYDIDAPRRHALSVASDDERTTMLVKSVQNGAFFQDLTSALELAETFHPPRVVHALFRGLFVRPADIAPHYAAMLAFIYGKATSAFDWAHRPLFLEFGSDDGADRERAFVALCALLGIDPVATRAQIGRHNED